MKFEFALQREVELAKQERWPFIIPLGVLEYHGMHCAYGCDTLIPMGILDRLENKREKIMIAPPFWYGPASYAVTTAKKGCSINVDYDALEKIFCGIFESLLRNGWRNIYVIVFHQSEDLLPMQLACMKASKIVTFKYLQDEYGEGWWGSNQNKDFYERSNSIDHPWNWINVVRLGQGLENNDFHLDHAGKWETSLLMALYPEAVKLERVNDSDEWFCQSANGANIEIGDRMADMLVDNLDKLLR